MAAILKKILSGGQTGVDRAALDSALAAGLAIGGWCPRGRLAEDSRIPDRYALADANPRTLNIAGPRASRWPQAYRCAFSFLERLLAAS